MTVSTRAIKLYRKDLQDAIGDRNKLSQLHSLITESINESYGEEKEMLVKFRQEIKDALNCRLMTSW